MSDEFYKGIPNWANSLNSIHNKLEDAANPLRGLQNITSKLNTNFGAYDMARQISQMQDQLYKSQQATDFLFAPSLNVNKMINAIEQMNIKSNMMQALVGGSIHAMLAEQMIYTQQPKGFDFSAISAGILEKINAHSKLYDNQLTLAEKLSKGFFAANHLALPSWVDKIESAHRTFNVANIRTFDLLSATTLTRIAEELEYEEDETPEDTISTITDLIGENVALKQDLESLYLAFAKRITNKVKRKKRRVTSQDLKEPLRIVTEIIHKHLLGKTGVSLQTTYIFVWMVNFTLWTILFNMLMEAKGKDMFDSVFSEKEKQIQTPQVINNNYSVINNYNYVSQDMVNEDASIYLRNSIKTKCLGRVKKGIIVLIIQQKPKWCFVETIIIANDRKTGKDFEKVVKGWILKKNLAYFQ
jgi:hypothetical protein